MHTGNCSSSSKKSSIPNGVCTFSSSETEPLKPKNEITKNKTKQHIVGSSENEDKLIEKLQDTWQVLYQELKPENNTFDDVDQIRDAFKKWKEKQKAKYKKRFSDGDKNERKRNDDYYDTQDYMCYDNTKGLGSLMVFLEDF